MKNTFENKKILITGGAGSCGKEIVKQLLTLKPAIIRIFSRDESKHFAMHYEFGDQDTIRYLVGDIRDKNRLYMALEDVDFVFHTAALKHVESCEYNPFESIKTNIIGTQNVIETCLERNVKKVIFTSSDKAANPFNTLGASKLMAERLMTAANYYRGKKKTIFASVRFGNVLGSRGSIIPLFINQISKGGPVTITDLKMTRFIMTISSASELIVKAMELAKSGEIFILKMPALKIADLAEVLIEKIAPEVGKDPTQIRVETVGIKPGEKLHEELMAENESIRAIETSDMIVLLPLIYETKKINRKKIIPTKKIYSSKDSKLLSKKQIWDYLIAHGVLNERRMA
ncbi:SDR family NAD(P)-dependent oxidoreductase [Chlamydiota bacterium]